MNNYFNFDVDSIRRSNELGHANYSADYSVNLEELEKIKAQKRAISKIMEDQAQEQLKRDAVIAKMQASYEQAQKNNELILKYNSYKDHCKFYNQPALSFNSWLSELKANQITSW